MQRALMWFILLVTSVPALSATTNEEAASEMLLQLATDRFGKLSIGERRLVNAGAKGFTAACQYLSEGDNNIRGELLAWVWTNPKATAQLTYRGISITGAEIITLVNIEWAKISFPIMLSDCVLKDGISLMHSDMVHLSLRNSWVAKMDVSGAHFKGDIDLNGTTLTH